MIRFVSRLFGRLFRTLLLGAILVAGLAAGVYAWHAWRELEAAIASAGIAGSYAVSYEFLRGSRAPVETGWPFTVRAYVKRLDAHNWIPVEGRGLVSAVLQWSPDQDTWVGEGRDPIDASKRLRLELLIGDPRNGRLIEDLMDPDPITREVVFRELRIRTGKDFGYRPDGPEAERAEAVARWEAWWEENRVKRPALRAGPKPREAG